MKIKYSPTGGAKKAAPRNWEVWLADAPFGPNGKILRCPVAVGKRTATGWPVYRIVSFGDMGSSDVSITDLMKAGQDRPCAVRVVPATLQSSAFIQKMGELCQTDIGKILATQK